MSDQSERIINQIRALLSKTVENGCTEAEAMTAAAKAQLLIERFNLTADSVAVGAVEAVKVEWPHKPGCHPVGYCAKAVARYTGTRIYVDKRPKIEQTTDLFGTATVKKIEQQMLTIIGLKHECDVADYIMRICATAMDGSAASALQAENDERRSCNEPLIMGLERVKWIYDFQIGMATRMSETLKSMAADSEKHVLLEANTTGRGNALVAVRRNLIAELMQREGIHLRAAAKRFIDNDSAYNRGQSAGAGIKFHSGVGASGRTMALGGY